MKRSDYVLKALTYIILTMGAIVCIFPFYWMIKTSLVSLGDIFQMPPKLLPIDPGLNNYKTALTSYRFDRFYLNSTIITALTILGVIITSSMCAYSFARMYWKGRDLVFSIILTGLMLPFFVVMIPQFIGWRAMGLTDTFAPLIVPAWFGGGVFNIFLLRQFFLTIPRELDEAALIDGANHVRIYTQIIIPLSKQTLLVVGLLTFLSSWNDYLGPTIFLSSEKNYTLMLGLNLFLGSYQAQWNYMMAATAVVVLPSIIIYLFVQRYFIEGIAMSGIKG